MAKNLQPTSTLLIAGAVIFLVVKYIYDKATTKETASSMMLSAPGQFQ